VFILLQAEWARLGSLEERNVRLCAISVEDLYLA